MVFEDYIDNFATLSFDILQVNEKVYLTDQKRLKK
jgi:hypothetical protein